MKHINREEIYKHLKSYSKSETPLNQLVEELFYKDLVEFVYEYWFEKLPNNPEIDDFLDAALNIYKDMHQLNYRLGIYGDKHDSYLNFIIACHTMEKYPDNPAICKFLGVAKYPASPKMLEECQKDLAGELYKKKIEDYIRENINTEQLRDKIKKTVSSQFDESMIEIVTLGQKELLVKVKTKEFNKTDEPFGVYLWRLMEQKGLSEAQLAHQMDANQGVVSNLLPGAKNNKQRARKSPMKKDIIYRLAFGLSLRLGECMELFKVAKIDPERYTGTEEAIEKEKKRDQLIWSLLQFTPEAVKAEGGSNIICEAADNILEEKGFRTMKKR